MLRIKITMRNLTLNIFIQKEVIKMMEQTRDLAGFA